MNFIIEIVDKAYQGFWHIVLILFYTMPRNPGVRNPPTFVTKYFFFAGYFDDKK